MKPAYSRLIIGLSVILGIVVAFSLYLAWPLMTGTNIILETRPVDPFDPVRGQYMVIAYEISSVPVIADMQVNDIAYVRLSEDNTGIARYAGIDRKKPLEGIFLRGKITSIDGETMRMKYGIEQFFFERHLEIPPTNLTVSARVSSGGQARIVDLLHNGQPVEEKDTTEQ